MNVSTDKITDTMAARIGAARRVVDARVMPYAVPAGRKARQQAAEQAAKQMQQARMLMQEKIVPMASTAVDNARVASAPMRREAMRRSRLAAAALRGADSTVVMKKRRWPLTLGLLAVGGALGAAIAWLSQAGRPVQLAPYPVPGEHSDSHDAGVVDITEDDPSHQSS